MSDRSLKGWPNQSQQKEVQSEKDTRNPTTNKKIHGTPVQFKRSEYYLQPRVNPRFYEHHSREEFPSIEREIQYLVDERNRYMDKGKYKKASKIQEKIKRAKSVMVSQEISQKREYYQSYRQSITEAYKKSVQYLRRSLSQFRDRFRLRKMEFIQYYKNQDRKDVNQARNKLQRKCKSLRSHSKEIIDLQKKQEYFKKKGDFKQLFRIKKQLKLARERQKQIKQKKIQSWAYQQQKRLSLNKSKKYNALMSRLEQCQYDRERIFAREQRRLKQKYKNVLAQLQHQKTMDFCNTQMLLSFDN